MPYKFEQEQQKIPRNKDRRIKLTEDERDEIRRLYGTISQRKLAQMFGVSRRLITFIGDPKQHEKNLLRRKENGGSMQYYDKDKNKIAMKKHRHYKYTLYKKGELIGQNDNEKRDN